MIKITIPTETDWGDGKQPIAGSMKKVLSEKAQIIEPNKKAIKSPALGYSFLEGAFGLEGDFGREINEQVQGKYGKFEAISKIKYADNIIKGSNPFYVIAVNKFLPKGFATAAPEDLEKIIELNALQLKEQYEDSALVLRTEENPNAYLARDLMAQIKARNPNAKMPAMIPLSELELIADANSPHQLAFKLKDNSEIIYTPELAVENNQKKFSKTNEKGMPIFDNNGNRTIYTCKSGLSRLCLGRLLDLDSGDEGLAYSDDDGRVVVVSAEGASQKI